MTNPSQPIAASVLEFKVALLAQWFGCVNNSPKTVNPSKTLKTSLERKLEPVDNKMTNTKMKYKRSNE